jgi:two-component system OmpR family response regulator
MRVLVVEDEQRVAIAIKRSLEGMAFAVDVVSDGDSGLSHASDADYDVIILDRMLPGTVDGMEICRQLRHDKIDTPVLMLTALGEVDDRIAGLQAGADDYLPKPFSMPELLARVQVLLRRPRSSNGPVMTVADLSVNVENFEVLRAGMPISLSVREFKLLRYLLHNNGKVVTKDSIISHAWDSDADIMPNTVEVYIGYLRRKLDKAFPDSPQLIHTVRGFGYRLGGSDV